MKSKQFTNDQHVKYNFAQEKYKKYICSPFLIVNQAESIEFS